MASTGVAISTGQHRNSQDKRESCGLGSLAEHFGTQIVTIDAGYFLDAPDLFRRDIAPLHPHLYAVAGLIAGSGQTGYPIILRVILGAKLYGFH
jgi:hypothetical protein